jgi:hypothetical protein
MAEARCCEESFSFRFIRLTAEVASRLRFQLSSFNLESRRPDVISLPLREGIDYELLQQFVESERMDQADYSVWASIVTSRDHGGLSLPPYVLEIVRRTRAGVDFSFVACLDPDEEETEDGLDEEEMGRGNGENSGGTDGENGTA